jgi:hypothetical protein
VRSCLSKAQSLPLSCAFSDLLMVSMAARSLMCGSKKLLSSPFLSQVAGEIECKSRQCATLRKSPLLSNLLEPERPAQAQQRSANHGNHGLGQRFYRQHCSGHLLCHRHGARLHRRLPHILQNRNAVPAASLPGEHWMTVVQRLNDISAQTRFRVRTNWAERVSLPTVNASTHMRNILTPYNVSAIDALWSFFAGLP